MRSVKLKIYGKVQGVYFRVHTQENARQLSLNGYVKNCPDGTVEALAEGDDKNVEAFIEWCRKGPIEASVLRVDIHESTVKNYSGFAILRD
ncbi:MAG: acylphosphatase [Bacteroidetes bacterium]|nr:MAG: acylphosphatase [Bacteroidota bacterium]REK04683.1 MAG: acylphosphatase [Bacteroidota bacterium]REK36158.1 MAG: acylphosphatase [Bacteroidota bacterium]REK51471.1 MAG: acylphosphatase [Bacteroidota bacterium]